MDPTQFFSFLISIQLCALTFVQSARLFQLRSDNNTYDNNRNHLFSTITTDTEIEYGFYNVSYGQDSDKVNAIGLCRGDLKPDSCRNCIKHATNEFTCNNSRTAIVWYGKCMLRYSDGSIFGKMAFEPYCALRDDNMATNVSHFDQVLSTLSDDLITQTASGDSLLKFATGNATVSNSEIIYALAQCTPDLSLVDCKDCRSNATDVLSKFCSGRLGARVFTPSCNVRYDKGIFYDRLPVLPLPPVAADAPVSSPVDAPSLSPSPSTSLSLSPSPSPSPPVALAPPQQPYIEIAESNMNSGFQVLVTVVPLMILQYFVF